MIKKIKSFSTVREKNISLCISIVMLCCLTMNYIINIIGSNLLYIAVLAITLVFFLISVREIPITRYYNVMTQWWIAAIVIAVSTFRSSFDINIYVDIYAIVVFLIIISACGEHNTVFENSIRLIYLFSLYYAMSIWIQMLIPSIYNIFLTLIPSRNSEFIHEFQTSNTGYTGFTTNPGFTAGYIVCGLIVVASRMLIASSHTKITEMLKNVIMVLFLTVTLLLTGKRGHFLAFIVSIIFVYLASAYGAQKIGRIGKLLLVFAVAIVVLMFSGELFSSIPALSRVASTITGLINGEDITNNRTILYGFAIQLFKAHPIFGVGWGQYRLQTVGNITLVRTIETHNIYLQMLCEMGIVGFVCMIIPMISSLRLAAKNLILIRNNSEDSFWNAQMLFSLGYQIFFLVYGLSGNPLYDHNCLLMYLFAVMIAVSYERKSKRYLM